MDYQGRQIFIAHPDPDVCNKLVRALRRNEYETFGFYKLDVDISILMRDSVIFISISEDSSWDWREFLRSVGELEVNVAMVAFGVSELPEGFSYFIESADDKSLDGMLAYLEKIQARGPRHFVRFGSQLASIATFNFHYGDRLFAGVIHDVSSTGLSCTFKPEPDTPIPEEVEDLNLNIHGYRISLGGKFTLDRVSAGQIIHVFNFKDSIPDEALDSIYDFIYSSLETKLYLH